MKKLDLFWKSNKAWWEFRDGVPVLKDDAPQEAKDSYTNYLKQMKE